MDTTSVQTVTEYEQHQLDMLLWQADVHERNGREREAFEIRAWVADFSKPLIRGNPFETNRRKDIEQEQ
jgi:hypothetical protein